jgi:hypothetical protein
VVPYWWDGNECIYLPSCGADAGYLVDGMLAPLSHSGAGHFSIGGTGSEPTVIDLYSGLEWRRCSPGQTWDGSTCTGPHGSWSWSSAKTQCTDSWGGYSDWRVAEVDEYDSLFDFSTAFPVLDETSFPGLSPWGGTKTWFWSQTQEAGAGTRGIMILFVLGQTWEDNNVAPVMCVRLGSEATGRRFEITPDDNGLIVEDSWTGLRWERCAIGQTWDGETCTGIPTELTYQEAMDACSQAHHGYDDWRLPDIRELRSIRKQCDTAPLIDEAAFPGTGTRQFWSSTLRADDQSQAYNVSFASAYSAPRLPDETYRARCVRPGPP